LTLNAQNSKEEYDNAVDYCACKIAYAYTNQYISNGKSESYNQNEFNKEKKSFESTIKNKLESCKTGEHIAFDNLKTLLSNNNFSGFVTKLEGAVEESKKVNIDSIDKQQAIHNILNSFYDNEDFSKIVLKYSAVKELKSSLETDLNNTLNSFKEQTSIENNKTIKTADTTSTNEDNRSNREITEDGGVRAQSSFFPNWLLFTIIFLASIVLFLSNHLKIVKLKESAKRHRDEIEDLKKKISIFNQSNNKNQNNSRFERDVYQKISDLNIAIERLQNSNNTSSTSSVQKTNQVKSIPTTKPKEIQKFVYAKTPISDKVFNASDVTENKDGKFYKFLIEDNNQAEFEFFNTENSAIRAVNAPDSFLYPACEETEPLNQNAKKIITNKPGIAIKIDDKWIVKEKAQITYE
jgi:hypothetical protein